NLLAKMVDGGRYAAVSIGYRLSWQATWPAQIDDSKAAIRWIRAHAKDYNFDPERICLFGVSSGAHMAVKVGLTNGDAAHEGRLGPNLKQSSRVQCVIDELGPMDLRNSGPAGASNPITQLLGGTSAEKPDLARDASPILDVSAKAVPFLIIAGNKDPFVPYQQSVALDEALRKAGAPVVLFQTVDGGGHGDFGAARSVVEDRMLLFLERNFYDPSTPVPTDTLHK
ncbi:MAG: alpha/beta hydrolase, partial [Proteobacteria bacterium]|nr:alpha/beta hydrolase [Pseudomonadota bacterium]